MSQVHLHIIIPQGTADSPKKEKNFVQFLNNLYKTTPGQVLSFEILGKNQYAYFYIVCDAEISKTVEGLIYSSFPNCEIRRGADYCNNFKESQHFLMGSTLKFRKSDIHPILDFNAFEGDSLSGVLSVISKLNRDNQAWIQIVTQPINNDWRFQLNRRTKMQLNSIGRKFQLKNFVRLKNIKEHINQEDAGLIGKSESAPFYIQIKVASVAPTHQEARENMQTIAKSFFQFNKSDANGFVINKIESGTTFLRDYQSRQLRKPTLVNINELATLYHLPNSDHVPHVVHVLAKKHEAPKDLPTENKLEISLFGQTNYHNDLQQFGINREDRRRHLYVVGKSGVGKSKLLELLVQSDLEAGKGLAVLDPHGDLVDNILKLIPENRKNDVVIFDPSDTDFPIAFNPLEKVDDKFKMQITIGFIDIFKKLFANNWSSRMEHVLRYTTLALLDSPNTTVLSILKMLTDKSYRQSIISRIQDSVVKNFWVNEFSSWSEKFDAEAITPLLNKVGQLVSTNMIRNIIGQPTNTFNIREIMDNKKILLMKVSKGLLGEENSQLIGSMIITKIYQAAMARADIQQENREDFNFYVDEFQNFATNTFSEILSEARKYRLCLTIAHQYIGQLSEDIRKTVMGNVGSMISFRVGAEDAAILSKEYTPIFEVRDIINLGVREFYLKMSIKGELSEAFSGQTLDLKFPEKDLTQEIIEISRKKYCMPKKEVETILSTWDESSSKVTTTSEPATPQTNNQKPVNSFDDTPTYEVPLI